MRSSGTARPKPSPLPWKPHSGNRPPTNPPTQERRNARDRSTPPSWWIRRGLLKSRFRRPKVRVSAGYQSMTVEEIKGIRLPLEEDAVLFLWCPQDPPPRCIRYIGTVGDWNIGTYSFGAKKVLGGRPTPAGPTSSLWSSVRGVAWIQRKCRSHHDLPRVLPGPRGSLVDKTPGVRPR